MTTQTIIGMAIGTCRNCSSVHQWSEDAISEIRKQARKQDRTVHRTAAQYMECCDNPRHFWGETHVHEDLTKAGENNE